MLLSLQSYNHRPPPLLFKGQPDSEMASSITANAEGKKEQQLVSKEDVKLCWYRPGLGFSRAALDQ